MKINNIVFIHIPRTSGTYLEDCFKKKFNFNTKKPWWKTDKKHLFGILKISENQYLTLQHLTLYEMIQNNFVNINTKKYIFTVVRNPYDRIVSVYNRSFKHMNFDKFLLKVETIVKNYDFDNNKVESDYKKNFPKIVKNLNNSKYFIIPQYYFICNNKKILFDKPKVDIHKYEDLTKLNNKLKLNLKMHYKSNTFVLTEKQKEKIASIYKIDFERLGYDY